MPYLWWITNLLFWIIFLMHSEHWKQGHAGLLQVCPLPMMMSHQCNGGRNGCQALTVELKLRLQSRRGRECTLCLL